MENILEKDGIKLYAPEFAYKNSDYPNEIFEKLYDIEDKNFWFCSRSNVINHLINKFLKSGDNYNKKFHYCPVKSKIQVKSVL